MATVIEQRDSIIFSLIAMSTQVVLICFAVWVFIVAVDVCESANVIQLATAAHAGERG